MVEKIIVIGGSISGIFSAISAARFSRDCKVVVLSDEKPPLYRRPSIVDILRGTGTLDNIKWPIKIPENVKIVHNVKVEKIDADNKLVKVRNIAFEKRNSIKYDSLIIATGSVPILPEVEGIDLKGVHLMRFLEDAVKISNRVKVGDTCIVVGGGFTALLIADALFKRGVKPVLCVRSRLLRRIVEPDVSEILEKEILKNCRIIHGNLEKIIGSREAEYVKINGEKIRTSTIILATGTRPSVELANNTGIHVSEEGIQVDEKMTTSIPNVYAAGDCTATLDFISKKYTYMPLASKAAIEGTIAGCNAAGKKLKSSGFIRSQFERVFNLDIITIGLTLDDARNAHLKAKEADLNFPKELRKGIRAIKMICNDKDEPIGLQLVAFSSSYVQKYLLQNQKEAICMKSVVWQQLMKFLLKNRYSFR
jgi:NADPH-dependent 2,4-dienoyl-CoA reductase/sulfur reductase-like enzyme